MAQARKKRTLREGFAGFGGTIEGLTIDRPLAWWHGIKAKFSNLPKTNFDLGCDFAESGRWLDATFRFRLAIWLQPNFTQAWYNLGCCYMKLRKYGKAKQAFKKTLFLKPQHSEALFMLSAVDPNAVPANAKPTRMPKSTVLEFFRQIAPVYDEVMSRNRYAGPQLMFDNVKPLLKQTNGLHVVDLGCGTGLLSRPWRTIAVEITGVDFCPEMIAGARAARVNDKPLFETLLTDDIITLPAAALAARGADVVLLGDTAQFLGDLASTFAAVATALKPGGLLGITFEPLNAAAGYAVSADTGRFGHHPEYVKKAAAQAGLELKKEARVSFYPNFSVPLLVFAAKEGS